MSNGTYAISVSGVYKLIMDASGVSADSRGAVKDDGELADAAAQAYMLTMLAVGAGNSASAGAWGTIL